MQSLQPASDRPSTRYNATTETIVVLKKVRWYKHPTFFSHPTTKVLYIKKAP